MRGGAEPEEADALAFFDAGDAEAAKADDSGAQERSGVEIIEGGGDWKDKIGASQRVFGVASVDCVAGKGWRVAKVLFATPAVRASAIGAAEPGNPDAGWCRASLDRADEGVRPYVGIAYFDYLADDLVAGDDSRVERREFAFHDVEVGAADSAGEDAEQDVAGVGRGRGNIFDSKRMIRDWLRRNEDYGFHERLL